MTHNQVQFEDKTQVLEVENRLTFQKLYSTVNPYPDDTPTGPLTRLVKYLDLAWGPSGIGGVAQILFDPIIALVTTSPTHANILGDVITGTGTNVGMYRYMQCEVEVSIKINSTQYHQGCLCAGWLPQLAPDQCAGRFYAPSHDGILMSASLQEQCTFTIPFMTSRPHYDLLGWQQSHPNRVFITVINTLVTSSPSIIDTIPVSVWLQMKNVKLYGVMPQTFPGTKTPVESNKRCEFDMQSTHRNKFHVEKEAETKDHQGISAPGPKSIIKPILDSIPIVGEVVRLGSAIMNLDKPASDQGVTYTANRPGRGMGLLTGVDYSEPIGSFPSYSVSKEIGPMESSDMNVVDYCRKPALFYQASVVSAGIIVQLTMHPMKYYISTQRTEPDFLAFGSSFYQYWRGTIKLLFHFVATPFYSCRFRISVTHANGAPATIDIGTGAFSRIVDVKGDTWTALTVPYLSRRIWSYVNFDYHSDFSYLTIEALTDVLGSSLPSDALIYMNIYRAAGDDFQLAGLHNAQMIAPAPMNNNNHLVHGDSTKKREVFQQQSSLKDKFKETFMGITSSQTGLHEEGLFMADGSTTIADTCKRFYPYVAGGSFSYPYTFLAAGFTTLPAYFWAYTFLYWRGSRRVKFTPKASSKIIFINDVTGIPTFGGGYASFDEVAAQAVVPWFSTESYYPTVDRDSILNYWSTARPLACSPSTALGDDTTYNQWFAIGDDFKYFFVVQPFVSHLFSSGERQKKAVKVDKI